MSSQPFKRGDTSRPIRATLLEESGAKPIDLTGKTVRFIMRSRIVSPVVRVEGGCTILDEKSGTVEREWQEGDTDVVASYDVEFRVRSPDGSEEGVPNAGYDTIDIEPNLELE